MDASMIADWPARCILMKRGIKSSLIAIQLELDWKGHSETAKIGRHYCEQRSPLKTACYIWTGDGVTVTSNENHQTAWAIYHVHGCSGRLYNEYWVYKQNIPIFVKIKQNIPKSKIMKQNVTKS
uniref:AlNc14C200G8679 protein n=1 Tax=Albugo laibachii Nc14 TaxID=890382 RepID=F0WQL0_9STRA|nr:AlNc14C200G8679 [Albugo laibachii Nc14]|eukprot:CCA23619.1 AlNc14C200G8679 [Albugo laibachii Nc14]